MVFRVERAVSVAIACAFLVACGGGGGGGSGGGSGGASENKSGGWGAPEKTFDAGVSDLYTKSVAIDDSGNVHVLATLTDPVTQGSSVAYRRRSASGTWSGEYNLTGYSSGYVIKNSHMAVENIGGGEAALLTSLYDETNPNEHAQDVIFRRVDAVGGIGSATTIRSGKSSSVPRVLNVVAKGPSLYWMERTYKDPVRILEKYSLFTRNMKAAVDGASAAPIFSDFEFTYTSTGTRYNRFIVAKQAGGRPSFGIVGDDMFWWPGWALPLSSPTIKTSRMLADGSVANLEDHAEARMGDLGRYGMTVLDLKVDAAGREFMLLTNSTSSFETTKQLWVKIFTPGAGWANPVRVDKMVGQNANSPSLDVDAAGNALLVWHEYNGDAAFAIWGAFYTRAGGWSEPAIFSLQSGHRYDQFYSPKVKFDGQGNAIVVWTRSGFFENKAYINSRRYVKGAGWEAEVRVSRVSASLSGSDYSLDVNANGQAVLHWSDSYFDASLNRNVGASWVSVFKP